MDRLWLGPKHRHRYSRKRFLAWLVHSAQGGGVLCHLPPLPIPSRCFKGFAVLSLKCGPANANEWAETTKAWFRSQAEF